jgi:hypothetical protein
MGVSNLVAMAREWELMFEWIEKAQMWAPVSFEKFNPGAKSELEAKLQAADARAGEIGHTLADFRAKIAAVRAVVEAANVCVKPEPIAPIRVAEKEAEAVKDEGVVLESRSIEGRFGDMHVIEIRRMQNGGIEEWVDRNPSKSIYDYEEQKEALKAAKEAAAALKAATEATRLLKEQNDAQARIQYELRQKIEKEERDKDYRERATPEEICDDVCNLVLAVPDERDRQELDELAAKARLEFNRYLYDRGEFYVMRVLYNFVQKIRPFLGKDDADSLAVGTFLKDYLWRWFGDAYMGQDERIVHSRERRVNYYKQCPEKLKQAREKRQREEEEIERARKAGQ